MDALRAFLGVLVLLAGSLLVLAGVLAVGLAPDGMTALVGWIVLCAGCVLLGVRLAG